MDGISQVKRRPFSRPDEIISEDKRAFSRPSETTILCQKCKITFKKRKNLYVHTRKFHPEENVLIKGKQACAICSESFRLISQLHEHLQNKHDVSLKFINETFYREEDFLEWKEKIEKETHSSFISRNSNENPELGIKISYYICHRSGILNSQRKKRRHKAAGSVKCGYTCPAIINVHKQTVNDICEIRVQHQSVHVGHDFEVGKLRLSREDRISLASSLRMGVPMSKILDETRSKYSPTTRYGLITRKDLHNIKRDFKIESDVVLQKNDAISVDILIEKMKNDNENPVLVYKPLFKLLPDFPAVERDEFLLGIMNEAQIKLLHLYGNSCIMIDSTQRNLYGFQVTTVMVHDENYESLPVAVLFSSNTAAESLIPFFTEIKKKLPNLKTNILMTSDTDSFYNAWQAIFNDEPRHLLCSWHVSKSWNANINSKVKDNNNKTCMKAELKKILTEVDVTTFEKQMSNFIQVYRDEEDFINYFKTYYEKRSEKWAYCFRKGLGINTNIKLEPWHRQLKYKESSCTVMKQLDKAITSVMNTIAKKLLSRIISMEQRNLTSLVSLIHKCHRISLEMGENYNVAEIDNKYVITKTEDCSAQTYDIEKSSKVCDCAIKCVECNICIHSFSCTCIDYCIRFIICKHIHYICQNSKLVFSKDSDDDNLIVNIHDEKEEHNFKKQKTMLKNKSVKSVEINKKNEVLNLIQDLHRKMQNVESAGVLQYVEDSIKAINAYLNPSVG